MAASLFVGIGNLRDMLSEKKRGSYVSGYVDGKVIDTELSFREEEREGLVAFLESVCQHCQKTGQWRMADELAELLSHKVMPSVEQKPI